MKKTPQKKKLKAGAKLKVLNLSKKKKKNLNPSADKIKVKTPSLIVEEDEQEVEKLKMTPYELAITAKTQHGKKLKTMDGNLMAYDRGIYSPVDMKKFRKLITGIDGIFTTDGRTNGAVKILMNLSSEIKSNKGSYKLALNNGTYDLKKGKFIPHSPKHNLINRIPLDWNPEAKCPKFKKFMNRTFKGDSSIKEKKKALQMVFGSCMMPHSDYHTITFLHGLGGSGKSTALKLMESVIGEENTQNIMAHELGGRFARVEIEGKLANLGPETSASKKVNWEILKAISAGDRIWSDNKHSKGKQFKPFCTLVFAAEALPKLSEINNGIKRRLIIIDFLNVVGKKEKEKDYAKKLFKVEGAGIFQWAIRGYKALSKHEEFPRLKFMEDAVHNYFVASNHFLMFAEEYLVPDDNMTLKVDEILNEYERWRKKTGHDKMSRSQIGKLLKNILKYGPHKPQNKSSYYCKLKKLVRKSG